MESLLAAIKSIFYRDTSIKNSNLEQLTASEVVQLLQQEQQKQQQQPKETKPQELQPAAVLPKELAEHLESSSIDYELEFVNFLNRHGPQNIAYKFQTMLPYLTASLAAWPSYWLYRGFYWKHKRGTNRLGLYIYRTYQHAKIIQVAILVTGLLMSSLAQKKQGTVTKLTVMGLMNIISGIKNWTMENVFGVFNKQEKEQGLPNLGKEIQEMINTKEFERVVDSSGPFLLAALGVWPGYWLYRGFDYHTHRAYIPLPVYIRQTVFQAKLLQLGIILAGIYTVLQEQRRPKNERQDLDDDDDD